MKKLLFDSTRRQKRTHWLDFLSVHTNIWAAARYLDPSATTAFSQIPELILDNNSVILKNKDIAQTLIQDFFSPLLHMLPRPTTDMAPA